MIFVPREVAHDSKLHRQGPKSFGPVAACMALFLRCFVFVGVDCIVVVHFWCGVGRGAFRGRPDETQEQTAGGSVNREPQGRKKVKSENTHISETPGAACHEVYQCSSFSRRAAHTSGRSEARKVRRDN